MKKARAGDRLDAALAAAAVAAIAIPFLAVRFAPIADLPQQVAQIRLAGEALSDPAGLYRVDWAAPNRLSYVLLAAGWLLFGPDHAGRVAMLAIGLLWVAAAFVAVRRRGRPAEAAVLASVVFFNHTTYWGLYSFALGLPAFVLFVHGVDRAPARLGWRSGAGVLGGLLVLFLAHALWFAAGVAWLVAAAAVAGGARAVVSSLAAASPALAWAISWDRSLQGSAFDSPPVWSGAARWRPEWISDAALGGLRGWEEGALAAGFLAWGIAGALRAREALPASPPAPARSGGAGPGAAADRRDRWDRALLLAAALLALAGLVLPDATNGTIAFATRWMPMALFLALLAAPAPPGRRGWHAALACAAALAFSARTAAAWRAVEADELSGLAESLAALPERPRLLGLDLVEDSAHVLGRPFLHVFAYGQAERGGTLAFSFSVFPSSLVHRQRFPPEPWRKNLVWDGARATRADAAWFDHVLVNADGDAPHARVAEALGLAPVTPEGRWRLYRVVRGAPEANGAAAARGDAR